MRWSTPLLVILGLLLAGSVAVNFVLYKTTDKYYREANSTRLDPSGLNYYSQLPEDIQNSEQLGPANMRLVIFGDSRAEGWKLPAIEGVEVINRGIGSQTSAQVLQRFTAHVVPLEPDIILVQVGINDLKTIGLFPDQSETIISDYQANIVQIVRQAQDTGAVVVLSTILPAGDIPLVRRLVWSDAIDLAVVEMNDYLKTFGNEPNVFIFDGFSLIADATMDGRLNSIYYKDDLHFTQAGYEVLNEALIVQLRSLSLPDEDVPLEK